MAHEFKPAAFNATLVSRGQNFVPATEHFRKNRHVTNCRCQIFSLQVHATCSLMFADLSETLERNTSFSETDTTHTRENLRCYIKRLYIERFSFECREAIGFASTTLHELLGKLAALSHPIRSSGRSRGGSRWLDPPYFW